MSDQVARRVSLNGRILWEPEASLSVSDRAVLFGEGLFETIGVRRGRPLFLSRHLARLARSAPLLGLELPWDEALLTEIAREFLAVEPPASALLRITVTAGEPGRSPELLMTLRELAPPDEAGLRTTVCGRHPRTFIPGLKTVSYLPFRTALRAAQERGFDEALLHYGDELVEASRANLFLVFGDRLKTPGLESGCLPGIGRELLIEQCGAAGLPVEETTVRVGDLAAATEVFLTSAARGVTAVAAVDEMRFTGAGGAVTGELSSRYRLLCRRESGE